MEAAPSDNSRDPSLLRRLLRVGRLAVAVVLVFLLAREAGIGDLLGGGASVKAGPLVLAALLVPVALVIRAYNHALLLNRPQRVLGLADAFSLTLVGVALNMIVPLVASDMLKARWGLKAHGSPESMVVSTGLDKLTSLSAVAWMGVIGAFALQTWWVAAVAAALGVLALAPFLAPRRVPWRWVVKLLSPASEPDLEVIQRCAQVPGGLLAWSLTVSFAGWVATYAVIWLCLLGVGGVVSAWTVAMLAPLSTIVRLIPVSIGGIGVGEVTLAAMLVGSGVSSELAARGVLLAMLLLVILPGAVGAVILAVREP